MRVKADPCLQAALDGATPLHSAAAGTTARHSTMVTLLLGWGASPLLLDQQGNTPLHTAAYHGAIQTLSTLIDAGDEGAVPFAQLTSSMHP